jgi:branched-chain amino acid transport system substrate-binding protein
VILAAIKGGAKDRAAVLAAVKATDMAGVTKQIKFGENGEATEGNIFLYQVKEGKITFLQEIK